MGNAVTGEHMQHDRACMHATCIRRRWPHPCPAHSLDLGPPHKLPAGTREGGRTPAWGLGHLQGNTEWPEQCPLPQQLQELRKEPWGQQPTLACAPPPTASRRRETHVSRELPVFCCSRPSVSQDRDSSVTLTPPLLHVPNSDAGRAPPCTCPPGTLGSGGHAWVGQSVAEPQSVWGRVLLGWVSKSEDLRAGCRV